MIGGIYCEIPMGKFYNRVVTQSVQKRMRTLLGIRVRYLESEYLDSLIVEALKEATDKVFTQRRAKGYTDRTYNLAQSYGFAVYFNKKMYSSKRKNFGQTATTHPQGISGEISFENFVSGYKPYNNNFVVVLTAAVPYAGDVEQTYGKHVLIQMVDFIAKSLWSRFRRTGHLLYGYQFENSQTSLAL